MDNSNKDNILLPMPRAELARHCIDEVRFWKGVSLALAIFAAGLIASLLIALVVMLVSSSSLPAGLATLGAPTQ